MTAIIENPYPDAPAAWRRWLAMATVAVMPLSINIERILGPQKRPYYFSPFEILLPILFVLMVLDLLAKKPWVRFRWPHPATILWASIAVVSCVWAIGFPRAEVLSDWTKAAANPILVVLIPAWVFANISADPAEYRRLLLILLGSMGVCVLIALGQYLGAVGLPYNPDDPTRALNGVSNIRLGGWYENRMLFGAQAAMLVPAAVALAASDRDPLARTLCALLAAIALCVTLAAGGVLGALAGIAAVAAGCLLLRRALPAALILAGAFALIVVVLPHLPAKRANAATVLRGLALFAKPKETSDEKKPTARLRRYQAALDYLSSTRDPMKPETLPNWILGAGAGRYNAMINQFYDPVAYDKPGGRTDDEAKYDMEVHERDGFGMIEKTGVELGSVGLLALAFLFSAWILSAASTLAPAGDSISQWKVLALAAVGAGAGALIVSLFVFPAQRGAGSGGTLAFFFALAWRARKELTSSRTY